jgi:hypothetical protein
MVKVDIDISAIKNEIAQIHSELHATYNMNDTQRRDAVNRLVERVRTLKSRLEETQIVSNLK